MSRSSSVDDASLSLPFVPPLPLADGSKIAEAAVAVAAVAAVAAAAVAAAAVPVD
ncbi:hypothetical protein V8E53_012662 [Lactarius tabidus]